MKKITIHTRYISLPADTLTPVSIYLKVRDKYNNAILLESSDYHTSQNSFSFICFDPIAAIKVSDKTVSLNYPGKNTSTLKLSDKKNVIGEIEKFKNSFHTEDTGQKFPSSGLFGYNTYDAVNYFEDIEFTGKPAAEIPDIIYSLYRYVIVINHFNDELFVFCHDTNEETIPEKLETLLSLLDNRNISMYSFTTTGDEKRNLTGTEFKQLVTKGKEHCRRGDVFQLVLSRAFSQQFTGDEFAVYRSLRSINPSPYLFYFDYGSFRLFGSSPEAQLVIKNNIAEVHPIAGTFKRTGNDEADLQATEMLKADKKENAEHVMLVDLARNDLSRNCSNVEVKNFKEVHFYSHVIHLVSKVTGKLRNTGSAYQVMADSFPAGTLSGAPKHKAMQLINRYENSKRGFYGGCIGFMGFDGSFNHAIMIRTFLSKGNTLYYQAGAGIVVNSDEEKELQEINNKIGALRKAITLAAAANTISTQKKNEEHELINH